MAEQRKKFMSILLWFPGNPKPTKMEPFPAEQWPDQPGAEPGMFRVRLNGRWLDGRWRCMVVGEPEPVLCDDLEVL